MSKFFHFGARKFKSQAVLTAAFIVVAMGAAGRRLAALHATVPTAASPEESLVDGFRHVEAASVSDAVEEITGRKLYMTHHMRPIIDTKFAGVAVTVVLKKDIQGPPPSPACSRPSTMEAPIRYTSWLWRTEWISPAWAG